VGPEVRIRLPPAESLIANLLGAGGIRKAVVQPLPRLRAGADLSLCRRSEVASVASGTTSSNPSSSSEESANHWFLLQRKAFSLADSSEPQQRKWERRGGPRDAMRAMLG
jgi:hypothetical protein